ncbi:hypothetical protein ES703_46985 [subsurface metagenome]
MVIEFYKENSKGNSYLMSPQQRLLDVDLQKNYFFFNFS